MSNLRDLFGPYTGLFARTELRLAEADEPQIFTRIISPASIAKTSATKRVAVPPGGAGSSIDEAATWIPAIAEALERYCSSVVPEQKIIFASANELGEQAVNLDSFPSCSERELAHPQCPLKRVDKGAQIRWVRGVSLADGRITYLPVTAVYLTRPIVDAENFLHRISTGCAAHVSYEEAMLAAILEVIERDALSVLWLQKLAVSPIELENPAGVLGPLWEAHQHSSQSLQVEFFDATTDIGIPVVYGLRRSLLDGKLSTVVACSSSLSPELACRKVMYELASCAGWLRRVGSTPDKVEDFSELFHGASYMARAEQACAFEFLARCPFPIPIDRMKANSFVKPVGDCRIELARVLERLNQLGHAVYAVDLTTVEALRVGIKVVRAIIPSLMPFSWVQRARYLGHKRLYQAPRAMTFPVLCEDELNPYPQPFG